jgi:hypothetical protein
MVLWKMVAVFLALCKWFFHKHGFGLGLWTIIVRYGGLLSIRVSGIACYGQLETLCQLIIMILSIRAVIYGIYGQSEVCTKICSGTLPQTRQPHGCFTGNFFAPLIRPPFCIHGIIGYTALLPYVLKIREQAPQR